MCRYINVCICRERVHMCACMHVCEYVKGGEYTCVQICVCVCVYERERDVDVYTFVYVGAHTWRPDEDAGCPPLCLSVMPLR